MRNKILCLLIITIFTCEVLSQDLAETKVNVFFGQLFSSLYYKDSDGKADEYLNNNIRSTYGVSYQKFIPGGFL